MKVPIKSVDVILYGGGGFHSVFLESISLNKKIVAGQHELRTTSKCLFFMQVGGTNQRNKSKDAQDSL